MIIKILEVTNKIDNISLDNVTSITWLNQVSCYKQGIKIKKKEVMNKDSLTYEMNIMGPEIFIFKKDFNQVQQITINITRTIRKQTNANDLSPKVFNYN